jgi:hypothetical protein
LNVPVYVPDGWSALTFRSAPTLSVVVAPASVYVPEAGVLWKLFTVMLFVPSVIVIPAGEGGNVMVMALPSSPVIVKEATVFTGEIIARVTPPVEERTLAGETVTTPAVVPFHITPKCRSAPATCVMERGEIITAEAEAEALVCAKIPEENPSITTAIAKNLMIFFIFFFSFG